MAAPSCPACAADVSRVIRRAFQDEISIWECARCALLFCSPLPQQQSHSAGPNSVLTGEGYTENLLSGTAARAVQYEQLATNRYRQYSSVLRRSNLRLLEIGCGACGLSHTYRKLGVEYHGVDIDSRVIHAAQRSGVQNATNGDFLEVPFSGKFDVITSSQVLEHIKYPAQFIAKAYDLLVPGGVLHLDVPDHHSLPSLLYRLPLKPTRWGGIIYPHHLFSYSRQSLGALCESLFSVQVFNTTIMDRTWGQVTFENSLLAKLSPVLKFLNAGSILVAFGQKRESPGGSFIPPSTNS